MRLTGHPTRMHLAAALTGLVVLGAQGMTLPLEKLLAPVILAQLAPPASPVADEVITVEAGETVEMIPATRDPQATYSWVLLKDQKFLEATRDRVFRTRQVQTGDYLLEAGLDEPTSGLQARRVFRIRVIPHTPKDPAQATGTPVQTVTTFPPLDGDVIGMPKDVQVVKFTPDQTSAVRFAIILDATQPQAAPDNMSTGSFTDATPLFVWFPVMEERSIEVAIQRKDGTIDRRTLHLGESKLPETIVSAQGIIASARDDGSVRFTLEKPLPVSPTLVLWDFGDGSQSLVTSPVHLYARDGTYVVRASVRDLRTGTVTNNAQTAISVTGIGGGSSSAGSEQSSSLSSSSASAASSASSAASGGSFAFLSSPFVQTIVILMIILIILAFVVWLVLALLRRLRLHERLEDAETTLLKEDKLKTVTDAPAPALTIKRSTPVIDVVPEETMEENIADAQEDDRKEEAAQVAATKKRDEQVVPPEPVIDESNAPTWLKKGLETPLSPAKPEPAVDTPAPETVSPEPAPAPTPEPVIAETAPLAGSDAPAPSWLQAAPTPTVEPAPPPAPTPVAEPKPEPKPEPIKEPTPVVAPPAQAPKVEPKPSVAQAPTPAAVNSPEANARSERERERRRLKRQRYRENLKKRKQEDKVAAPATPLPTPVKPPETKPVVQAPVVPTSAPVEAPKPQIESPAPIVEIATPAPEPELPAPSVEDFLPPAAPAPEVPTPVTMEEGKTETIAPTAPVTPAPSETPQNNDEDVKFIIKAESISADDNGTGSAAK